MDYEKIYTEKYQAMRKASQEYTKTNTIVDYMKYLHCVKEFHLLCEKILTELLKKDCDILKRLKEES